MTRRCPQCNFAIEFEPVDGETIICSTCELDCEIHIDIAVDLQGDQEQKIILLEPLTNLPPSGFLPLETD